MRIDQCVNCRLHKYRRNVVKGRGEKPADILFIGEAPGKTEDLLGEAFVGPSGKLLDRMLKDAAKIIKVSKEDLPSYYITNTILCRPTDSREGDNREPQYDEVLCCMKNVMKISKKVDPKVVVFIGKISEKYYADEFDEHSSVSIQHPAYLLRTGGTKSPYYRTNILKLSEVFRRFIYK